MASVVGNGSGVTKPLLVEKPSVVELIADLVSGADAATNVQKRDEKPRQGILLKGSKNRPRVYRALRRAGYDAVFRTRVDRKEYIPDESSLHVIDLNAYFEMYGH